MHLDVVIIAVVVQGMSQSAHAPHMQSRVIVMQRSSFSVERL
jgi:hypothetical protein